MRTPIWVLSFLILLSSISSCATEKTDKIHRAGGFVAIIASDAETSAQWYATTFTLDTVREINNDRFHIKLLKGNVGFVEIIEFKPSAPDGVNRAKGLFKAGFIIDAFDASVTGWRENNVSFHGDGEVFFDKALDVHSIMLRDPDGNRIQVFGLSKVD